MLVCLPASGDSTITFLACMQMNTGLQKWETTQKMGSASYPTPAQLDAYAKRVANSPLTIQIFPNSVKVPQRKHVRRTVNGLDTSLSGQRHSPYPARVSSNRGLLAVLRAPSKAVVKESRGGRARQLPKAAMNPHNGPYAAHSTLTLPPSAHNLRCSSGPAVEPPPRPSAARPQALQLQQGLSRPPGRAAPSSQALQQTGAPHLQGLTRAQMLQQQQQQQRQRLAHPPGVQRQQGGAPPQQGHPGASVAPQPLRPPPQASLPQQGLTQELRHMPDAPLLVTVQQDQGPGLAHAAAGPPASSDGPQRKLPDADAPPNVTVSTSTIPLSMAAGLHQNRPGDLSSIVHQINRLCQARAGAGATSVCEGQIANPSPISRNLLINASSRVSSLASGLADKAPAPAPAPNPAAMAASAFHREAEKAHLQQLQQLQRSWAQHQLDHLQQPPPEGAHPRKHPRLEHPTESDFPPRSLAYPHKLAASAPFPLNRAADPPPPSSPPSCAMASAPYANARYAQPPWSRIPLAAGRDLPAALFQREPPGNEDLGRPAPTKGLDFLGRDPHAGRFQEQRMDTAAEKTRRSATGQIHGFGSDGGLHPHAPGYH